MIEKEAIKNLKEIIDLSNEEIENNDQNTTAILDITDLKSLAIVLKALENKNKEIQELKEKWDKDTHTLQNQLDLANADRIEKDKIIKLMAEFMNKRSWKEHQLKDDDCYCCKIEYSSKECVDCIIKYFQKKAREENDRKIR